MKPKTRNLIVKVWYYQRYLGWFLILIGIPIIFFSKGKGTEMPLMFGLFTLFTSLEKVEDERSAQMKSTSLTFAFVLAYAFKLLSTNMFDNGWINFQLVQINHFIILVLAAALVIYNFGLHYPARKE